MLKTILWEDFKREIIFEVAKASCVTETRNLDAADIFFYHFALFPWQNLKRLDGSRDILHEIRFIANRLREEDGDTTVKDDWKFAAIVLDRLFLWIIVGFTIGFTGGVLISAPHFQV